MTQRENNIIIIGRFVGFLIVFILGSLKCCNSKPIEPAIEIHSDTVFVHSTDTVTIHKDSIIYKEKKVLDTVYVHDTVLVKEQKVYEDSVSRIYISGIEPEIDSIIHFIPRDTVVVTTETTKTIVKQKKSGLGITLGIYGGYGGYVHNGHVGLAPEFGVGGCIGWTYIIK